MKLSEIKAGDTVILDNGFYCRMGGKALIQATSYGELYFHCSEGRHYIDGQLDKNGDLVGIHPYYGT